MEQQRRVVIITGGTYGIGKGIVRLFASRGDAVVIAGRNADRGLALEAEIRESEGCSVFVQTDVRSEASIHNLIDRVVAAWGRLDVLCNNAGIERYALANEYSIDDFNAIMETNLRGMFLCAKHAFRHLRERQGAIVNVSSVQAIANEPKISVYAASKAGILALTRGMAVDFGPGGVRVNAVCPGAIENTGMFENSLASPADAASVSASVSRAIPLGRMGEPEDIARAVYFLASPEASYIHGASLVVDGGLLAKLAL